MTCSRDGKFPGKLQFCVDQNAQPVVNPPRKVPWAVKESFKKELDRLVNLGGLVKVSEPTPWVSTCVFVVKPKKVRICFDPSDLYKTLKRNHYPMPTIHDVAN